ncbi:tetratricopeptide repeat protein [Myxococcus sp. SDU36]|nr:tetratricopeptide repeat protein [Myxococcus sp. SDU36]
MGDCLALLEVVVSDSAPRGEEEKVVVPEVLAEAVIRGEITLGQFLNLSHTQLYAWADKAYQLLQVGSSQQALQIFQGLVAASPTDAVFHAQLGATFMTLERFDEAFDAFRLALQFNDGHVDALVGRGEIHLRRGNVPEALADLSKAIQLDAGLKRRATQRAHATLLTLKQQADQVKKTR